MVTLDQSDLVPLRMTPCLRSARKCQSQACKQPSITLLFNFRRSRSWGGTLSSALAKSGKTTSVGQLRDKLRYLAQQFIDDNSCVTVDLPFRKPIGIGFYLSDQFLAKTYATYHEQFFSQFYKR